MIELLQRYTLSDIIIFSILLVLAIKSLISLFDWAHDRLNKKLHKQTVKVDEKQLLEQRLQHGSQIMFTLQSNQEMTDNILNDLSAKIDMLIDSDKDAIKSYITEKHHYFFYQQKWIDDFSLDCLERRYDHYEDQGGNSFIGSLMDDLRGLPKQPPAAIQEKKGE